MWTSPRLSFTAIFLIATSLQAGTAHASAPSCTVDPSCNELLLHGKIAHNQKDYAVALEAYEAAYIRVPDPLLLVLVGRTRFKMGEAASAIALYHRAEPGLTNGSDRERLKQYVAEAEAMLAAAPPAPVVEMPKRAAIAGTGGAQDGGPVLTVVPTAHERSTRQAPIYKRWWFWTAVGVTAAGIATGLGVGLKSRDPDTTGLDNYYPFQM